MTHTPSYLGRADPGIWETILMTCSETPIQGCFHMFSGDSALLSLRMHVSVCSPILSSPYLPSHPLRLCGAVAIFLTGSVWTSFQEFSLVFSVL